MEKYQKPKIKQNLDMKKLDKIIVSAGAPTTPT